MRRDIKLIRNGTISYKSVFVDGLPGNGKSLVSSIISTLKNFEKVSYIEEVEIVLSLLSLKKIDEKTAICLVDHFLDFKIYNQMMGRDVNFRKKDISSILNYHSPEIYKRRLFSKGDEKVVNLIKKTKPILTLPTHYILPYLFPIIKKLHNDVLCLEIVRHPAYLIKQISTSATGSLVNNLRNWTTCFEYKKKSIPFYAKGWKKNFIMMNNIEKAIFFIKNYYREIDILAKKKDLNFFFIIFEEFVKKPEIYINKICKITKSKKTIFTDKYLKLHKIPRKKIAESLELNAYKKLGWRKPFKRFSEREEINFRINWVKKRVKKKIFNIFLQTCNFYENTYWRP